MERPIRVLHVVEAFGGGLYEVVRLLAEGGVSAGQAAAIAYGRRPETPASPRAEIDERVDLFALPWDRRSLRAQLRSARAIRRLAREWAPTVIHLHSSFAGFAGCFASPRGIPVVYSPQGFASALSSRPRAVSSAYLALERLIARRVTLVAAASKGEGRYARERVLAPRVAVLENGIRELDDPVEADERQGPPRVIAAGRLVAQRRPEQCARILAGVHDLAEVAWIGEVGDGHEESGRRALVEAEIPLSGWVPRQEWLSELGKATVYLHWTSWDGQPLSILEAMAMDTVVVASDISPIRDLLPAEQRRDTEQGAIELVRQVLTDGSFAAGLREGQRKRRPHYAASAMVARWRDQYARLSLDGGTVATLDGVNPSDYA